MTPPPPCERMGRVTARTAGRRRAEVGAERTRGSHPGRRLPHRADGYLYTTKTEGGCASSSARKPRHPRRKSDGSTDDHTPG